MTVAISRITNPLLADLASAADRATGQPDGMTSLAELKEYLADPSINQNHAMHLRDYVEALEQYDAMPEEQRHAIAAAAVAYADDWRNEIPNVKAAQEYFSARGITDPKHRHMIGEMGGTLHHWRLRASDLDVVTDEVAADGEISSDDRERLRAAASKEIVYRTPAPFMHDALAINAVKDAERRARIFQATYNDVAKQRLIDGLYQSNKPAVPTAATLAVLRSGQPAQAMVQQAHADAERLLKTSPRGWPYTDWVRPQYDVDAIAASVLRDWNEKNPIEPRKGRMLQALLTLSTDKTQYGPLMINETDTRMAVASAIVKCMTDAQLAQLDAPTVTALAGALHGGGRGWVVLNYLNPQERRTFPYLVSTPTGGPRRFAYAPGPLKPATKEIQRLQAATASRLEWRPFTEHYHPAFLIAERDT